VTRARLRNDGALVEILRDGSERPLAPRVDWARIDATTEAEVVTQIAEDEAEAIRHVVADARQIRP
jgi:putative transcriptional regulator